MTQRKAIVLIDGSNLYHKLKGISIARTSEFNYAAFCHSLAEKTQVISITYYVGKLRTKQSSLYERNLRFKQIDFFNNLKKQKINIHTGYLMKVDNTYHEKGIDVAMATDLLVGAYENTYDTAFLISSDTDLIPAIEKMKSLGKKLCYIGFSHNPSVALRRHATYYKLLGRKDILPFSKN